MKKHRVAGVGRQMPRPSELLVSSPEILPDCFYFSVEWAAQPPTQRRAGKERQGCVQ